MIHKRFLSETERVSHILSRVNIEDVANDSRIPIQVNGVCPQRRMSECRRRFAGNQISLINVRDLIGLFMEPSFGNIALLL